MSSNVSSVIVHTAVAGTRASAGVNAIVAAAGADGEATGVGVGALGALPHADERGGREQPAVRIDDGLVDLQPAVQAGDGVGDGDRSRVARHDRHRRADRPVPTMRTNASRSADGAGASSVTVQTDSRSSDSGTTNVPSSPGPIVQSPMTGGSAPYWQEYCPLNVAAGSTAPNGSSTTLTMLNELGHAHDRVLGEELLLRVRPREHESPGGSRTGWPHAYDASRSRSWLGRVLDTGAGPPDADGSIDTSPPLAIVPSASADRDVRLGRHAALAVQREVLGGAADVALRRPGHDLADEHRARCRA